MAINSAFSFAVIFERLMSPLSLILRRTPVSRFLAGPTISAIASVVADATTGVFTISSNTSVLLLSVADFFVVRFFLATSVLVIVTSVGVTTFLTFAILFK